MVLAILPYKKGKRYIYSVDLKHHMIGILKVRKWNSKLKTSIPCGVTDKIPVLREFIVVGSGRFVLATNRVSVDYRSPSWLRSRILEEFGYMVWEEPRRRKPSDAFEILKDAIKSLHTYFVITSSKVYAQGFEPPNITISRIIVFKNVVVMIS